MGGRIFAGTLPNTELLREYELKGPLDEDKLALLREERLAIALRMSSEEEEWRHDKGVCEVQLADMILEQLALEAA